MRIPERGLGRSDLRTRMRAMRASDADWRGGRTWSMVYYAGEELSGAVHDAYLDFLFENGLGPMTFPSLRRLETETVSMTAGMLGGDADVVGSMTSGGTESILMAVKAARDRARATRPEVREPELLVPVTAHPAFDKAAHYLGLRTVTAPVGSDYRADIDAVRQLITPNTIFMAGSAIAYPHGTVDPIAEMAALAAERGIWFHSDACLGGFLLPWVKKLGFEVPDFDLRVPGVMSISADVHKYGFAAKGASVVLYRDAELRKFQFYIHTSWPGGVYATPALTGARPGGAIAAAWAAMTCLGEEGYLRLARGMMETTRKLVAGIESVQGLRILGKPVMTVLAFASDELDVYALADALQRRGWHVERQHLPASIHLMVTPAHERIVEPFLEDLRAAAEEVRGQSPAATTEMSAIYGLMGALPDRSLAKEAALEVLNQVYRPGEVDLGQLLGIR